MDEYRGLAVDLRGPVACLLLLLALVTTPSSAGQVRTVNLEEMTSRAATIFQGRCTEIRHEHDKALGIDVTLATFRIEQSVKGDPGPTIEVKFLGGSEPGSTKFAVSARKELETIFGKLRPLPADHVLCQGLFEGGADLSDGIRFKLSARQLMRRRGEKPSGQKLLVAMTDNRPTIIFSEFDLSAAIAGIESYRALGYKPPSARKIIGNILAYVMAD